MLPVAALGDEDEHVQVLVLVLLDVLADRVGRADRLAAARGAEERALDLVQDDGILQAPNETGGVGRSRGKNGCVIKGVVVHTPSFGDRPSERCLSGLTRSLEQNHRTFIEGCFEHGVYALLLYPENLTAGFFDLSSGEAGEILQKLRNYNVRLAIVRTPEQRLSSRFGELLADEGRGSYFRLFGDRQAAVEWLAAG